MGEARRTAVAVATALGFDVGACARVAMVATEAAANLARHARGGVLIVQPLPDLLPPALDIIAVDRGPGMRDPARCLTDGYSTAGTPGTGLGAVRRQASEFALHSVMGVGTVLLVRITAELSGSSARTTPTEPADFSALTVGAVCIPIEGETVAGDAWAARTEGGRTLVMVADGLGHGPAAAEAGERAVAILAEATPADGPGALIERAHAALRGTRGAAVAVAELRPAAGTARFAGVGNVAACVVTGRATRNMVSHNGIVGHQMRKVQEFDYAWEPDAILVLASDGVRTQSRIDAVPGLATEHPAVVAAALWRRFTRGRDDATVVVVRARVPDLWPRSAPQVT